MITQATDTDIAALAKMASHIWHNSTPDELRAAFAEIISADDAVCYIHYYCYCPQIRRGGAVPLPFSILLREG